LIAAPLPAQPSNAVRSAGRLSWLPGTVTTARNRLSLGRSHS
jgi:hypothetical protein